MKTIIVIMLMIGVCIFGSSNAQAKILTEDKAIQLEIFKDELTKTNQLVPAIEVIQMIDLIMGIATHADNCTELLDKMESNSLEAKKLLGDIYEEYEKLLDKHNVLVKEYNELNVEYQKLINK